MPFNNHDAIIIFKEIEIYFVLVFVIKKSMIIKFF